MSVCYRGQHTAAVTAVVGIPGAVITGGADGTVVLWDPAGAVMRVFHGHQSGISSIVPSVNGALLVTGSSQAFCPCHNHGLRAHSTKCRATTLRHLTGSSRWCS